MRRWLHGMLPRSLRRAAGRGRATMVAREVEKELRRVADSGRPVLAGPWLGEVGFEILYWVPWLRWFVTTFDVDPSRIVAMSRGGPESWYRGIAGRYIDVFDHVDAASFRAGNTRRLAEIGEQKQLRIAGFERELLALSAGAAPADAEWLHPAAMYRLYQPYWWQHASAEWVMTHARYAALPRLPLPAGLDIRPGEYTAVKFYSNACLPADAQSRRFVAAVTRDLAKRGPVVSLDTGLSLDDHAAAADEGGGIISIAHLTTARNNLAVQTAVLANARAFVGTYGGFSYVPPFHGVAATAIFARREGFDPAHLAMAEMAFRHVGAARFAAVDMATMSADAVAAGA